MNINIDYDKCRQLDCLECLDICPMQVFDFKDNKLIIAKLEKCVCCMACQDICNYNAIFLSTENH